jgi:transposase
MESSTASELPDDLAVAHQQIRELAATLRQQVALNQQLQHQLEQLLRQRYGRKSEQLDPGQLLLFVEEILAETEPPTPPPPVADLPVAAPEATKAKGHGRKPLPKSLPRQQIVHDVAPEHRLCPDCGTERERIGEDRREQLEYIPASLVVLEHIRPKYACPACAAHVVIAARTPEPIEKGLPGPGLLAHVAVSKYADHLPLYRQEGIFSRLGVELSRSTMCGWMAVSAELLEPIAKLMLSEILESKVVQTDDTTVPVQDASRDRTKTGRLWAYLGDRNHPYIVFDYTADRSRDGPERVLAEYQAGYLQSDAYTAYDRIHARGIVEVGCWAHARRKFYDARTTDPERSHQALAWISLLYEVERLAKKNDFDDAQRLALRQEKSLPVLTSFEAWMEQQLVRVLPKSPMGEALGYASRNRVALRRYLEAGFLEIDNNATERALRTVVLGRKNWLFAGSDNGGRTAATLISLTATCKALGVEPYAYLRDVLDRVSTHPMSRISELLPDRWQALRQTTEAAAMN